jgi:predicted secreted hydrolase
MRRRQLLLSGLGCAAWPALAAARQPDFATVTPGRVLRFPEDEGMHPEFRTEWWYVTGWLDAAAQLGFQVTFFRTRPHPDSANPSRFNPRHILIAHAALADRRYGRLRHEQRSARAGFGLAEARTGATDVWIDDWSLRARGNLYHTAIRARDFMLELDLEPKQPVLLHGEQGYSRKGPDAASASYYYTLPHLRVEGRVTVDSAVHKVVGLAWLDHEWSSQALDADAVGWDWTGINLDDGAALMAFRLRRANGSTHWAGGTLRDGMGKTVTFAPDAVDWKLERSWRSARTGATYPVSARVRVGTTELQLVPLLEDQELDSRISTGAIYWEGAVTALDGAGKRAGRGYLELTGYARPLRF